MNKKNYKKIMDDNKKNQLDDIPKNQRIITKKEVKTLGLTIKFKIIYLIDLFFVLVLYATLLYIWINYFSKKNNLYLLMNKNMLLEMTAYKALNAYHLMIFQIFTIDEITEIILPKRKNENNSLLKSIYTDLKLAFDSEKEKRYVQDIYIDFEDRCDFTCEKLFEFNSEYLKKKKVIQKQKI